MKKSVKFVAVLLVLFTMGMVAGTVAPNVNVNTTYALTLKQGSSGSQVRTMQTKLKNWGYYKGTVDGIYGPKTKEAVKYFQRKNGLVVDGIAGNKTLKALGMSTTGSSSSGSSTYSDADVYLLARLIYGEARGESYEGQVAVGAVILNRVKHSDFPNTIAGVIYQPGAFTAVSDGQINEPIATGSTVVKAAQDALNGWDPSGGAIYYFNPNTATNKWIWSRKQIKTIGQHIFCK